MELEDIRQIALALPGAKEDIKWGHDLCFVVAEKMFFVTGLDQQPVSGSLKVKDEEFDELCAQPGFSPAPYLARHKWIAIDDINRLKRDELEHYIRQSYELVVAKLPKKKRDELIGPYTQLLKGGK